jgi:thioesterase domain-containing protein/acyl carrier protein
MFVLDDRLMPVPVGIAGKLHIGGSGVARGYVGLTELTAEKFIPDPFGKTAEARLYRTGDLARYDSQGNLHFLGRNDSQIKLRGFRIELAEIEAALGAHASVQQAIVLLREDIPGDKRLVAYIVPSRTRSLDTAELLRELRQALPEYMVPSAIVLLDSFTLTPNGKVDLRALPAPESAGLIPTPERAAPRDELEIRLVKIWEGVLNTRPIGVRHSFFELGGHSLLVAKMLARIERDFGKNVSMAELFQSPTIEKLANLLRESSSTVPRRVVPIQTAGSQPPFFCLGADLLFLPLAQRLRSDQPFLGLVELQPSEAGRLPIPYRLEDIAAYLVRSIREYQPEGPYYLGGWCLDGIVAYEVSRQLMAQGQTVGLLVLFETPNLDYHRVSKEAGANPWRERIKYHLTNLWQLSRGEALSYLRRLAREVCQKARLVSWRASYKLRLVMNARRMRDVAQIVYVAVKSYRPQPYAGRVAFFQAAERPPGQAWDIQLGWRDLVSGGFEVHEIPGNHVSIYLEPNVGILASGLTACLREAQAEEQGERLAGDSR